MDLLSALSRRASTREKLNVTQTDTGPVRGRCLAEVQAEQTGFVGCGLWQTWRGSGALKDVQPLGWLRQTGG